MKKTLCIAGKNQIAVDAARHIMEHFPAYKLVASTNQNDEGHDSWQPSYKKFCQDNDIPIQALDDLYSIENLIFISLEFDRIIKPHLFTKGSKLYNMHFSKLPEYKGMYTSALPILHGRDYSAVTFHYIDKGIDTGDIIAQKTVPIDQEDTARDLYFNYLSHSIALFKTVIADILKGDYEAKPQPAEGASYFSKSSIDYSNLILDIRKTAYEVKCQVRAFTFAEYQLLEFSGINIHRCEITMTKSTDKPGTIIDDNASFMEVCTIDYNVLFFKSAENLK